MLIAYDSRTGNVKRFVQRLEREYVKIDEELKLHKPFILVTYTTGFGQVPQRTMQFLEHNAEWLRGVAVSGNRNWGTRYGLAGDHIARMFRVPLLMKFELSGTKNDIAAFKQEVEAIVDAATEMDSA